MKRVIRTKSHSSAQMKNMSVNLKNKFNKASCIQYSCMVYDHVDRVTFEYWIYVADIYGEYLHTWESLQDTYFKLMERSND